MTRLQKSAAKQEILKKWLKSDLAVAMFAQVASVHTMRAADESIVTELSAYAVPDVISKSELAPDFWRMQAGCVIRVEIVS